ncbi:MAG: hypothetical protein AB1Z98_02875 [Nannocystaceae bacterium]
MKLPRSLLSLPERFNWVESMLFAPQPARAREAAERYVTELLAHPAPPPRTSPAMPDCPALPL